jgi:membrane-bound lytic murein transglycosylase MltF
MLRRSAALLALVLLLAAPAALSQGADAAPDAVGNDGGDSLLLRLNEPFRGDWPAIRERRVLRVLTTYSRTNFLIENGRGRGLEYEAATWLETWLNTERSLPGGPANIRVVFVPLPFSGLLTALLGGRGDVVMAGMTATEERAARVAFARPYIRGVRERVVRHKAAPDLASAEELSGRTLLVLSGSSHLANARALHARLRAAGRPGVNIVEAPAALEEEDLLEMVNAGIAPYAVADGHLAAAWDRVMPDTELTEASLATNQNIAWAVRPDATELRALLDRFVEERVERDRSTAMTIWRRYFQDTRFLKNPVGLAERDRVRQLAPHFRGESERVGFNWLMMLAQGFQESQLDPAARSHVGALGVMQLMPATGREMGARDLTAAEQNIRAGIAYMDRLRGRYFNDPALAEEERVYFALAAYNAGPNRINRLREEAPKMGLDPNRWFGHMERVVQARVGSEPVRYVANIRAYFLTYAGLAEQAQERAEDREELRAALRAGRAN